MDFIEHANNILYAINKYKEIGSQRDIDYIKSGNENISTLIDSYYKKCKGQESSKEIDILWKSALNDYISVIYPTKKTGYPSSDILEMIASELEKVISMGDKYEPVMEVLKHSTIFYDDHLLTGAQDDQKSILDMPESGRKEYSASQPQL